MKHSRLNAFLAGVVVSLSCITSPAALGSPLDRKAVPVIVDTDMGPDDWLALAFVIQNPGFDLRGVTVVGNGLTPCPYGASNAQYLLQMAPQYRNIPVGCGAPWPMDGYASYPSVWHENGITMLGEIPKTEAPTAVYEDGARMLAKLLRESKEPVEIIAVGAMTNIANVLTAEPQLKSKIRRITTMGGAVDVPGNLRVHGFTDRHPNTKAEWNYYIDPVSARIVFASGVPIRLVPLNATNKVPLTKAFVERIKSAPVNPLQAFAARTFERITASTDNGEYYHWDPLAAVAAADPAVCDRTDRMRLSIVAQAGSDYGLDNGQPARTFPLSAYNGKARRALSEDSGATLASPQGNWVDVCMHADATRFESTYINVVSGNR